MAFVVVQHLAPEHESILPALLSKKTGMSVVQVRDGMIVSPNHVYVIPPNAELQIKDTVLHLSPIGPDRARRMPIDTFFQSLAEDQQGQAIGVILSGTASDGTLGVQAIKSMGGITFAQDDATAKYNAMPRSAVAAGSVDYVLSPYHIAGELRRIAKHHHTFNNGHSTHLPASAGQDDPLTKIYVLLRNYSRVDFSHYKPGTLTRRISRRMLLRKIETIQEYLQFLKKNRDEVEALFNDMLINVTGFFRDEKAFESLQKHAFPLIFNNKAPNSSVRIWVPGCSTGEEAYSLAISLLEFLGDRASSVQTQIFGTDISDAIIRKARAGMYPESIALNLTPTRLNRFFQKVANGYLISKTIRDMCVFAKQDIGKDPPFSKLDLISCRNVMIYMGPVLQKRILPVFHYALNQNGILFLGSSETVGGFADLFSTLDKKRKIYVKKAISAAHYNLDFVPHYDAKEEATPSKKESPPGPDLRSVADQIPIRTPQCSG